jgi:hypothetical protein
MLKFISSETSVVCGRKNVHYKTLKCLPGIDIHHIQSKYGLIFLSSQITFAMSLLIITEDYKTSLSRLESQFCMAWFTHSK